MKVFLIDYNLSCVTSSILSYPSKNDNHFAKIANYSENEASQHQISPIGNSIERKIHRALAYISDTHMMHSTRPTANLIDDISIRRPDVVHLNNVHMDYVNLPFLAHSLISMQIPTVITLSEHFPVTEKLPALIKRTNYNRRLFQTMFELWDLIFAVAPDPDTATRASRLLLNGHPIFTIEQKHPETIAESYRELFNNII